MEINLFQYILTMDDCVMMKEKNVTENISKSIDIFRIPNQRKSKYKLRENKTLFLENYDNLRQSTTDKSSHSHFDLNQIQKDILGFDSSRNIDNSLSNR